VDAVLFAVKSYDTRAAAEACRPLLGRGGAIIDIQNGVDNEDLLAALYGADCVLGGSTRIEATVDGPGAIARLSPIARLDMGPWGGGVTEQHRTLHATMLECSIDAHLDPDVRRVKWEKFLFICPAASVSAVSRASLGELVAVPETLALFRAAVAEVERVADASGVSLGGEAAVERVIEMVRSLPPAMKTSMLRDLERGRRLELDAFSGAVCRIGAARGVPTPVHEMLYAALKPAALAAERAARAVA
jgi:2-dehydropantoate 2-reductase